MGLYYTMHNLHPLDNQNTLVGEKGSGKTTLAMIYALKYLSQGKRLYTNFPLYSYWPSTVARARLGNNYSKAPRAIIRDYERQAMADAFHFDDLDDLYDERWPRRRGENPEDKMLCIFDEASIRLNSRTHTDRRAADKEKYNNAVRTTQFFSQGRKLGWTLLFIAQSEKDLDNQFRNQAGYVLRNRNLKKQGMFGFRTPLPLFRTSIYWGRTRIKTHFWPYPSYVGDMYDSWEVFDASDAAGLRRHLDPDDPFGVASTMREISDQLGGGRTLAGEATSQPGYDPPLMSGVPSDFARTPSITATAKLQNCISDPLHLLSSSKTKAPAVTRARKENG